MHRLTEAFRGPWISGWHSWSGGLFYKTPEGVCPAGFGLRAVVRRGRESAEIGITDYTPAFGARNFHQLLPGVAVVIDDEHERKMLSLRPGTSRNRAIDREYFQSFEDAIPFLEQEGARRIVTIARFIERELAVYRAELGITPNSDPKDFLRDGIFGPASSEWACMACAVNDRWKEIKKEPPFLQLERTAV